MNKKSNDNFSILGPKNPNLLKERKNDLKKKSFFLNIRNRQFDQRSPVQPNPYKKIRRNLEKISKIIVFKKIRKFLKYFFLPAKKLYCLSFAN